MSAAEEGQVRLDVEGEVATLTLLGEHNRFSVQLVNAINAALDSLSQQSGVRALVTQSAGLYYSDIIGMPYLETLDAKQQAEFWTSVCKLLARFTTLPLVTIAAIGGDALAAGAFFALSHDYRVMTQEGARFSFNEVFIPDRIPDFHLELLRCKFPSGGVLRDAVLFGKEFRGVDAKACGVVDVVCSPSVLLQQATQLATEHCQKKIGRLILHQMKCDLYHSALTKVGTSGYLPRPHIADEAGIWNE